MINRIGTFLNDMLARMPVELVSKLDRAEVVRRLQGAVDSEWVFGGGKRVIGRVGDDGFRLRVRIGYRNSFQTFMFGKVQSDGARTRIVARTGAHPFAATFMALWISVVGLGALAAVASLVHAPQGEAVPGLIVLVPIGMLAFGIVLVGVGRWFARDERGWLIAFLESTAEAKVQS